MAIGRCQYMTCGSMRGQSLRGDFFSGEHGQRQFREILICSECRPLVENARDSGLSMTLTKEGAVYLDLWMDSVVVNDRK